jgi:membrane protein YqaA with SNARE-associated domain
MYSLLSLYSSIIHLASHAKAKYYLFILSFAESSFFPIPPDVMLLPMCLANRAKLWQFALITTLGSVLGGIFGYLIGAFSFDYIAPLLEDRGYMSSYLQAVNWFEDWSFWAVFIAGFSPIPYKIFTIAAGALNMAFAPFVLASLIGRGARFYLIAFLVKVLGDRTDALIKRYVDKIGWVIIILLVVLFIIFQLF